MEDNSNLIVNGYCFGTVGDAETARQEVKKIEYLEAHMDYENPENVFLVYKKAIETRVFQTPIGWEYLKELRRRINSYDEIEKFKGKLPPITLYTTFTSRIGSKRLNLNVYGKAANKEKTKSSFIISIIINIILIISVGGMFAIALTSDNPNVLNYENSIVNKYSVWEQELTDRENAVREKEKEIRFSE